MCFIWDLRVTENASEDHSHRYKIIYDLEDAKGLL